MSKKALVTGAGGFIGSHLSELLVQEGYEVRALVQYNSGNNWQWLEGSRYKHDMEVVLGDVRDSFQCDSLAKGMNVIFNLAALIAIPFSYVAPQSYIDTNVSGAVNMCQATMRNDVDRLVQMSTSEVYGSAHFVPMTESHPLQPQSPYSASKIGADSIAMSYFNAFDLPVTIARPFNVYGPRQSARAVIPTIISQIASGMDEIKVGDVTPTRDFTFVTDTCKGLMDLGASSKTVGDVFNLGSGFEISIGELFQTIADIMNADVTFVSEDARRRPEKSEVTRLFSDSSKAREAFGFESSHDLAGGLQKTIQWFEDKQNLALYKPEIYNV
ncbi:SDR family NAD(P)-dependent oxidoreductase [Alphaproteobacteria bacterium]|nr:SDR family NAD(P)-dependent oxidoreductase [Alphaproteobacteria bacterium]